MSAATVNRTTYQLERSINDVVEEASINIVKSRTSYGASNYLYFTIGRVRMKVRISDHPIGMRRATSGDCDLYVTAGAKPSSWACWLSQVITEHGHHQEAVL